MPKSPRPLTQAQLLRRKCVRTLAGHRRRASKEGKTITYGVAELEALARSAKVCAYCGCLLGLDFEFDHARPVALGGAWTLDNLVVACKGCNRAKGKMTRALYLALLALLGEYHPAEREDVLRRLRAGGKRYTRGG